MIFKLDSTLLTFGAIGIFIKFLDTNNITNAFVSGGSPDPSPWLAAAYMNSYV
jgi:ACS family pantothenate transporter-like MFS transporter